MKSFAAAVPLAAAFFTTSALAWLPSCTWSDCMGSWDGSSCSSSTGWDCLCSNQTAISQLNTCVATSCTNTTDQEAIYGAVAQLCANAGSPVTHSQEATFSATSGGSAWPSQITAGPGFGPGGGWNSDQWSSWISACSTGLPSAPSGWGGQGPWGGPGAWGGRGGGPGGFPGGPGGGWGPWGTKASGIDCDSWTTWTAGWGPFSSWTGTWSGCSTTTNSPIPATITTTVTTDGSTQVITGTTFGIQALAAATTGADSDNAAPSLRGLGACGALVAAILATIVAL
ncbi:hypothetical protein CLCR_03058 [Cladophialophora carrionii]|uniref:CFEM domain-containing protein n=1 Tax=Cladophialophora carrionii TaxID=86049 RepID=A0A1C1D1S3_9EURO|nr:hypothetical protein CLCR_03058 [Cladophialophora carrionii]